MMKYYFSFLCLSVLAFSCDSRIEPLKKIIPMIKVGVIKEGVGHTPEDAINFTENKAVIIGPNDDNYAAAVCDYYENGEKIVDGIIWSTVNKNGGEEVPKKLHIHKHGDSYIVLVNLDYAEKNKVVLEVRLHKKDKLMATREIIVNKRSIPIQKTITVFQGEKKNAFQITNKLGATDILTIDPKSNTKNTVDFKFTIEDRTTTDRVNWSFVRKDGETKIPQGVVAHKSTPPLTGLYSISVDPNRYDYPTVLTLVIILKQDKLRLSRELIILPQTK